MQRGMEISKRGQEERPADSSLILPTLEGRGIDSLSWCNKLYKPSVLLKMGLNILWDRTHQGPFISIP